MNAQPLHEYLLKVAADGYAANQENRWTKEHDGSTTIVHHDGPWSMNDNFFGGEPYGGREVVFHEGTPVWIMVYYGTVARGVAEVGGIYSFLQRALSQTDHDCPLRGPTLLEDGAMRYENTWDGTIQKYAGREAIFVNGEEVYSARYVGGLVDVRGER
jgi:hypothetical protein